MTNIKELSERLTRLENKYDDLQEQQETLKNGCLNFFYLNSENIDLYYIKTPTLLFIFSNKSFIVNADFMQNYVLDYLKRRNWKIGKLNTSCTLYKEHYQAFKNEDIILYKYIDRDGLINKSVVSLDNKTGEIYIESQYIGKEHYKRSDSSVVYADQPKRKIIKGVTLQQYLTSRSVEEKNIIMRNALDYLFKNYPAKSGDRDKVSGVLLDAHFNNILVNEDGFYFIDKDVISDHDLSKSLYLFRVFNTSPKYQYFLSYYNLKDESSEYSKTYPLELRDTEKMQLLRKHNKLLLDKYFSDSGLSVSENFDIKLNIANKDYHEEIISIFDADWYAKMYPDFRIDCPNISGDVAIYHYINIGWKKGYNPSPNFDGNTYLDHNEDVKKAKMNPLWHYVFYGQKEKRQIFSVAI